MQAAAGDERMMVNSGRSPTPLNLRAHATNQLPWPSGRHRNTACGRFDETRQGAGPARWSGHGSKPPGPLIPNSAVSAPAMDEHATLQARICAAWIDLLRGNQGAEGRPDQYYAVSVENVRGHGEAFELCLTFRAGRTYCCCEDICHTGVFTAKRWRRVRAALAVHGVAPHKPLVVRICTRLEAGARLRHGRSDEPEPEACDRGPWTLTVHEQSSAVPIHHERFPGSALALGHPKDTRLPISARQAASPGEPAVPRRRYHITPPAPSSPRTGRTFPQTRCRANPAW